MKRKEKDHPFYSDDAIRRWDRRKKELELEERNQHKKTIARFKRQDKKEELDGKSE